MTAPARPRRRAPDPAPPAPPSVSAPAPIEGAVRLLFSLMARATAADLDAAARAMAAFAKEEAVVDLAGESFARDLRTHFALWAESKRDEEREVAERAARDAQPRSAVDLARALVRHQPARFEFETSDEFIASLAALTALLGDSKDTAP